MAESTVLMTCYTSVRPGLFVEADLLGDATDISAVTRKRTNKVPKATTDAVWLPPCLPLSNNLLLTQTKEVMNLVQVKSFGI